MFCRASFIALPVIDKILAENAAGEVHPNRSLGDGQE